MAMEISSPLDLRQGSWNSAVSRQSDCSEEAPTGFKVGEKLGRIVHRRPETTNIAFGGDDWKTLYFTNWAGINPEKPLDQQDWQDLLWIREPFLSDQRDYGRLIVHGHTPTRDGRPDLKRNRLNIDTGAVFGGPLTAAVFTDDQMDPIDFVQVRISTGTG
jgi:hypothetical protein